MKISELVQVVREEIRAVKIQKEEQDHEVSMAISQLQDIIRNAGELMYKIGPEEKDIPGWIQDHISQSQSFINQANTSYHELDSQPDPNQMALEGEKKKDVVAEELEKIYNDLVNSTGTLDEDLRKWFKEKWVRFGPDGKIKGDCARGSDSEGKPKCLPQSKAYTLGKKGRASAARRKRREDPNPERRGAAKNVATKKEGAALDEKQDACYHKVKARYKVWPSAYASGALVKCRKKGAKNWGNS